jgi:DNA-binding NarL/FixJ family response regulator
MTSQLLTEPLPTIGNPALHRAAELLASADDELAMLLRRPTLRATTVGELLEAGRAMRPKKSSRRHLRPVPDQLSPGETSPPLTERELQVVSLIAEGLSNKQIGARLGLSDKTVKNHISHILAKLNLTARTQVAVLALRKGLC